MVAFILRRKHNAGRYFEQEKLPRETAFVKRLSSLNQRRFTIDLHRAMAVNDDGQSVREVLESWKATAGVDADPDIRERLRAAPRDRKRYTTWEQTREQLDGK